MQAKARESVTSAASHAQHAQHEAPALAGKKRSSTAADIEAPTRCLDNPSALAIPRKGFNLPRFKKPPQPSGQHATGSNECGNGTANFKNGRLKLHHEPSEQVPADDSQTQLGNKQLGIKRKGLLLTSCVAGPLICSAVLPPTAPAHEHCVSSVVDVAISLPDKLKLSHSMSANVPSAAFAAAHAAAQPRNPIRVGDKARDASVSTAAKAHQSTTAATSHQQPLRLPAVLTSTLPTLAYPQSPYTSFGVRLLGLPAHSPLESLVEYLMHE